MSCKDNDNIDKENNAEVTQVSVPTDDAKLPDALEPQQPVEVKQEVEMTWADSLIVQYINKSDNPLFSMTRTDSIPITWMLDRREQTDTAFYLIYQLAHSFEHHLVPDAWLYMDSLSKTIYEYDIATEIIRKWKNQTNS
jgi:hypothetical protein